MNDIHRYLGATLAPAGVVLANAASQHRFASFQDLGAAIACGAFAALMLWCNSPKASPAEAESK